MGSVEFNRVEKVYPGNPKAIESFSLKIDAGELMVLVGPSGCGKSTLLRMLAGLEDINRGEIYISGQIVNQLSPQRRNVSMVFQDYALYPNMTVRSNLAFPLKMLRLSKKIIDQKVHKMADMLDLSVILDRYPKQLSGGQRQRVAMGRALVREPSVFLLDEPLSNLDAKLRVHVRAEISELQRRLGITMIYVTHDQIEAMTLGHRIAIIDQGRLQQVATPREIYDHPANIFVAGFIGHPAMNLFKARVYLDSQGFLQLDMGQNSFVLKDINIEEGFYRLGIRPEALKLTDGTKYDVGACIERSEFLGHETLLYVQPQTSDSSGSLRDFYANPIWIVRLQGLHVYQKGEQIKLCLTKFCLFSEDGMSLIATVSL